MSAGFENFLLSQGAIIKNGVLPDGKFHRIATQDKPRKRNGSYQAKADSKGIYYGYWRNWATGETAFYRRDGDNPLTSTISAADFERSRAELQKQQDELAQLKLESQKSAAATAALLLKEAYSVLTDFNPYLARKNIKHCSIARTIIQPLGQARKGDLFIPIFAGGALSGGQIIKNDGEKRFLTGTPMKGSSTLIGGEAGQTHIIAEGFATAATLYEALGVPILVAFNAGNLLPVAEALKGKGKIIIACDNDHKKANNVGLKEGMIAAAAADGFYAAPPFRKEEDGSDWNDYAALHPKNLSGVFAKAQAAPPGNEAELKQDLLESNIPQIPEIIARAGDINSLANLLPSVLTYEDALTLLDSFDFIDGGTKTFWRVFWKGEEQTGIHLINDFFKNKSYIVGEKVNGATETAPLTALQKKYFDNKYQDFFFCPIGDGTEKLIQKGTLRLYNRWRGFPFRPADKPITIQGSKIERFAAYVYDIIADSNDDSEAAVWEFMARIIQRPEKRTGINLTLADQVEGTGKSFFGKQFGRLIGGDYVVSLADARKLTAKFNSFLDGALLVLVEEFFSGNREESNIRKALTTAETIAIEGKGENIREAAIFANFIFSTNNINSAPADGRGRRELVLKTSHKRMGDLDYFAAIERDLENGGYAELMRYLLDYPVDLSRPMNIEGVGAIAEQRAFGKGQVEVFCSLILEEGLGEYNSEYEDRPTKYTPIFGKSFTNEEIWQDFSKKQRFGELGQGKFAPDKRQALATIRAIFRDCAERCRKGTKKALRFSTKEKITEYLKKSGLDFDLSEVD